MKKEQIVEMVKELFGCATKKEAEEMLVKFDSLVKGVSDKLEVGAKAKLGALTLEKSVTKGRTGEMTMKDGTKKPWTSEDKVVVKGKVK
jgi:hypothetical protein